MGSFFEIYENTWAMDDNGVRVFLLVGKEKALIVDTGRNRPGVAEAAREVTNLPQELLNTHADPDHISENDRFEWAYMHPSELVVYHNVQHADGKTRAVYDKDTIDLGGRVLEVIHVPGHTPGSITLLDKEHRCLIGGDPIQEGGHIFMFGIHRDMEAYIHGLKKLWERESEFDVIYPSHAKLCVDKPIIPKLIEGARDVTEGKITGRKAEIHGNEIMVYDFGPDCFLGEL
ncbi:MAG: MBL fold metallo-hydrolase [Lachnospiraceae bacterium]|nr:MBL fold metallo-hydrolase [Lachnospiraceae bacterium]